MASNRTSDDDGQAVGRSYSAGKRVALSALLLPLVLMAFVMWIRGVGSDSIVQRTATAIVMGTQCRIIAVGRREHVELALKKAIERLDTVDRAMSTYKPQNEVSRFNAAPAHVKIALSKDTLTVMRSAQEMTKKTSGAFDITVRPLVHLWSDAAMAGELPQEAVIQATLARVGGDKVIIDESAARKTVAGVEVSLDAIAKGYAVHKAIEAMRCYHLRAALVDVGGDIECFGTPLDSSAWNVGVQNPWSESEPLAVIEARATGYATAVCTSGNYRRHFTINGREYSHIIDPRTGLPANTWCSVTVTGPNAMVADEWATALSVLGADKGLKAIARHREVDAMFVSGTRQHPIVRMSPGFSSACRTDM